MSAFIVSGGSLLEIGSPSRLTRDTEQQVGFTTTLGGKRKAHVRKGGRREWSVNVSGALPGVVSTLETVARGLGPYGWYPQEAVEGNLLSPQASAFETAPSNASPVGLVQLPDGSIASTVLHFGTGRVSIGGGEVVPLLPGMPVSFGAWGLNGLRFWGTWRDASGGAIVAWSSGNMPFTGWQWRSYTITPPADAWGVDLELLYGTQYARPTISWGGTARDELGTGCPSAVIHAPSHSPAALWQGANYTDSSYTVTEVG